LTFVDQLWRLIAVPAVEALTRLGIKPPTLKAITPMEQFNVIWVKLPFLCALFIAAPWVVYQIELLSLPDFISASAAMPCHSCFAPPACSSWAAHSHIWHVDLAAAAVLKMFHKGI
jgi:Sec-independent protein secretion pathway component TatC